MSDKEITDFQIKNRKEFIDGDQCENHSKRNKNCFGKLKGAVKKYGNTGIFHLFRKLQIQLLYVPILTLL